MSEEGGGGWGGVRDIRGTPPGVPAPVGVTGLGADDRAVEGTFKGNTKDMKTKIGALPVPAV